MSKRELSRLIGTTDVEGSRPKRRREVVADEGFSPDVDVTMSNGVSSEWNSGGSYGSGNTVKEQGLKLWQTIKDAESKDSGRLLATDFLKKPPRRLYPDYYQIIKKPIALDDIKKRLDTNSYPSMQAVQSDFELLFNNALEYNMKDSGIWIDAKELLTLVHTYYNSNVSSPEVDDSSDDNEKKGKSKTPNLTHLIKSRLQKLIEKTDGTGRLIATEFMELPNKKQWAIYYKQIKKPQCLENIFRRIKRKEYHTAATFAADVELVFSNAMSFNQDHTPIWDDALTLRDYFRQLMSDLPPPYTLPEYPTKTFTNKIKIKPPVPPSHSQSSSKPEPSSSSLLLRVPASSTAHAKSGQSAAASTATKAKPSLSTPASTVKSVSNVAATSNVTAKPPVAPQPQLPTQVTQSVITQSAGNPTSATPQPTAASTLTYSHYSHSYQPAVAPIPITHTPVAAVTNVKPTPAPSASPAPTSVHPNHQIRLVKLRIQPRGRLFWLDYNEGVKTWALRLASGETSVDIDDLVFLGEVEEESSDEEEEEEDLRQEEEEEDMEADGTTSPTKNGRMRKGKTVIRRSQRAAAAPPARTTRSATASVHKNKAQERKKDDVDKVHEVQLKINGVEVKEKEDQGRHWNVGLPVGSNILEVGEKGGLMWKVYIERITD